jgi:hypothetical protein
MENEMNNIPPEVYIFTFFSSTDRSERDNAEQSWIKLHNEELYNLHSFSDILWIIESRRMKWAGMWEAWRRIEMQTKF